MGRCFVIVFMDFILVPPCSMGDFWILSRCSSGRLFVTTTKSAVRVRVRVRVSVRVSGER